MSADTTVFLGTGRRKTATARVRLTSGSGKIEVNGRQIEKYFTTEAFIHAATAPLKTVDLRDKVDVTVNSMGDARSLLGGTLLLAPLKLSLPRLRSPLPFQGTEGRPR